MTTETARYYRVILDARYDMSVAGLLPDDETAAAAAVSSFEAAYVAAAEAVEAAAGVEIEVVLVADGYDGAVSHEARHGAGHLTPTRQREIQEACERADEADLWQRLHDAMDEPSEPGGAWDYSRSEVERIAAALRA